MSDVSIRQEGKAGRITLTRPQALNALTHEMALAIEATLEDWAADETVALVILDAEGDKAFCAGGDIAKLYETGRAGDYAYGRRFWRDEYRLNARIARYAKPIVALMQGFVMGGGVGLAGHASHRVACATTRIALPECGIGLVPDVGSTHLLASAPGHVGTYLGLTGYRMDAADALFAGFADFCIDRASWPEMIDQLCSSGDVTAIAALGRTPERCALADRRGWIDTHFAKANVSAMVSSLREAAETGDETAAKDHKTLSCNSAISLAVTHAILTRLRLAGSTIERALDLEYRFTSRAMEQGDFLEGIRAAIIDKDRAPRWRQSLAEVAQDQIDTLLAPAEDGALFPEESP